VRGTVLEVELPACSDSTRALQNVTVFEGGPVDVNDQIVASGTVLSLCDGCPTNAEPRCDDCPSYHWVADQTHEQVLQSCFGQISINGTVSLCDTPNPYDPWLGMEFEGEGSRRIVSGTDSSIGILPRGGTNMCLGDYELRYPAEFGGVHAVIYAVHQPSGSTTTSIRGQYNLTGTNVLIQCDCRWTATSTIVE